jgi:hypothetical protein
VAAAESQPPPMPVVPLVVFGVIAVTSLAMFYVYWGADEPDDAPTRARRTAVIFLSAPDRLLEMWCGGKFEYFSLLDRWPLVLLVATILSGAWLSGRLLLEVLGVRAALDRLERAVFAIGIGLNLLSLYALAVGLFGGLQQRWLFVVPLVALLIASVALWLGKKTASEPMGNKEDACSTRGDPFPGADDWRWYLWLAAALPFALVMILGGMLPPWEYDVREYHLQTPKEWFQNGRVDFLPHNIYANMPLGSELMGLWGMALVGGPDGWWWGALAGKTVMACYSLVAAAGLVALGRRVHSLAAGVIAAVIYVSTPWIAWLASVGYNEGPVAMYALLAIFALWLAARPEKLAFATRLYVVAGFCAGSAVACKYPPLLFLVIPLAAWVGGVGYLPRREVQRPADGPINHRVHAASLIHTAVFLLAALAACGLWFGKNLALTNNPTYPLLYSLFDGRTRTPEKDRQWTRVHSPQPDAQGNRHSPRDLLTQIGWLLWGTRWASAALVPLAAMSFFAREQRRLIGAIALWMLFVFTTWWLFTHRLDRFLVLLVPLASLLAGIGAVAVSHFGWRVVTLSFVLWTAATQFVFVSIHPDNRYFAPLSAVRHDDLQLLYGGERLHPAHRWLNTYARPGECVLLLGDAEPFELEIPAIYNTCFDDCQFTRLFRGRSRAERLAALQAENIAYVFCHWPHLARFRRPGNYGYTSDYPTRELVHDELVGQRLLEPIPLPLVPEQGELFRVTSP